MRMAMLPSAVCEMYTPGTLAASARSIDSVGLRSRSSEVTIVPPLLGLGAGAILAAGSGSGAFPDAQPEMSPTYKAQKGTCGVSNAI